MANGFDPRVRSATSAPNFATATGVRQGAYDEGLRSYMLGVYNRMTSGVLLTGIVAMLFAPVAADLIVSRSPLMWVIMLAPLGFVMALSFGANRMQTSTMSVLFWAFAVAMGLSLSTVFLQYTGTSIAGAFFATAAAFAGLSLYGYTTKRDLSAFGTFLIMGLVGLIVASLVNLFLQSGTMALIISVIGVLLFAGLTAYDTQKIKSMYFEVAGTEFAGKAAIMGALSLYLDFINMFLFILRLFGSSRD
jgi:FtsH-binding integral membrane protein